MKSRTLDTKTLNPKNSKNTKALLNPFDKEYTLHYHRSPSKTPHPKHETLNPDKSLGS